MSVPSRIEQDVEILTGRRGNPGERAVRLKELTELDQRATALAGSVQRQIADAGIPSIRDKVESIRGFIYNTLTYVDNEVNLARDEFSDARDELQALIDAQGVTIVDIQDDVAGNTAGITLEAAARASDVSSLAGQILTIETNVADNASALTLEQLARANADSALAGQLLTLEGTTANTAALLTSEQLVRANADTAITTNLNTQISRIGAAEANITQQGNTLATLEGYAAASYVLRAAAGGAAAGLEIVAADDPISGAASALRFYADDILFDGSVTAQHIDASSLFISSGNVVGPLPQSQVTGLTDDLGNATTIANSKNTVYRSTSTPAGVRVGDIWYNPSTSVWRFWTGSSWTQASIVADSVVTNWLAAQTIIATQLTGTLNTDRINFEGTTLKKSPAGKLTITEDGVTRDLMQFGDVSNIGFASNGNCWISNWPNEANIVFFNIRLSNSDPNDEDLVRIRLRHSNTTSTATTSKEIFVRVDANDTDHWLNYVLYATHRNLGAGASVKQGNFFALEVASIGSGSTVVAEFNITAFGRSGV